jgi:large subunit ribosomal protein L10
MFAAEFSGLSVSQMQELRRRIAEDATFSVVKNTLARRAAEASEREEMLQHLAGPTGIVWITGDPARAAKALTEFGKEVDDLFAIKGGLLNGQPFAAEQVTALTKLPSREELIAKLAGGLAAPLHSLGALSQPLNQLGGGLSQLLSGLPNALNQLRQQKEAAGG